MDRRAFVQTTAAAAVAPRRRANELAALVPEAHGHTVDLRVADERQVRVGLELEPLEHALVPRLQILDVLDVVEREHALSMCDRGKGLGHGATDLVVADSPTQQIGERF